VVVDEEANEKTSLTDKSENDIELDQLIEVYVVNMLKNLGAQPLDKLHNMLSAYVPGFQKTLSQLTTFLDTLMKQDKIDFIQGLYTLKK
jgi:hypothetical protein